MSYRIRSTCRLCGSHKLDTVLQLQPTPPANEFVTPDRAAEAQQEFPLYLSQCGDCGHVQLPVVVAPDILFSNYVYVSGTSQSFVRHFSDYALDMVERFGLKPGDLVVDIGSNDGTLLGFFKAAGMRVLGVDPAKKIVAQANASGIETLCTFFDRVTAAKILSEYGSATLVLANNVFAHADDLRGIANGVKDILDPARGRFVFEVQYLVDLVQETLFDMVYHEHLSYHSLEPLVPFFGSIGMSVIDASRVPTHGGSIRVVVQSGQELESSVRMQELLRQENRALSGDPFGVMAHRIQRASRQVCDALQGVAGTVVGYGAPAKLTTLMYQFGIRPDQIAYVVDDSPWKQGLLTPGKHIPVKSPVLLLDPDNMPACILIFAWNFAEQIISKYPQFKGSFIVPLPEFKKV
jgi:SAM-dependent methyltransferase